jgi:hypothetical protein
VVALLVPDVHRALAGHHRRRAGRQVLAVLRLVVVEGTAALLQGVGPALRDLGELGGPLQRLGAVALALAVVRLEHDLHARRRDVADGGPVGVVVEVALRGGLAMRVREAAGRREDADQEQQQGASSRSLGHHRRKPVNRA